MTAQCRRELDANRHETPLIVIVAYRVAKGRLLCCNS